MIDIKKQYRTRDGREVRIYATDGSGRNPVHGSIKEEDGWIYNVWPKSGRYSEDDDEEHRIDLVEIKPRIKQLVWINVYPDNCFFVYQEKRKADIQAMGHRIACVQVEIDYSEGDGL